MYFRYFALALGAANTALTHTLLTNLLVDDVNQGDAVCIRMPEAGPNTTAPVTNIDSKDMACGYNGERGVARVCKVPQSGKLTFLFKLWPDGRAEGSIDESHRGSCAVYMKHMSNVTSTAGDGPGWFKIWDEGHDDEKNQWCTDKLIANKGLLSVRIPKDLLGGEYLVRAEILALHNADKTPSEPQFYNGCAQIFLNSNASSLPKDTVSIPGYIEHDHPGIHFNVWESEPKFPYPIPGPKRFQSGNDKVLKVEQDLSEMEIPGQIPNDAVIMNGNWWSREFSSYDNANDCWNKSGKECWAALDICYGLRVPTGNKNCQILEARCRAINEDCKKDNPRGPTDAGKVLTLPFKVFENVPPAANEGDGDGAEVGYIGGSETEIPLGPSMTTIFVTKTVVATPKQAPTSQKTRTTTKTRVAVDPGSSNSAEFATAGTSAPSSHKDMHLTSNSSGSSSNTTYLETASTQHGKLTALVPVKLANLENVEEGKVAKVTSTTTKCSTSTSTSSPRQGSKRSVYPRRHKFRRWGTSGHLRRREESFD